VNEQQASGNIPFLSTVPTSAASDRLVAGFGRTTTDNAVEVLAETKKNFLKT
jgi:hypothetical protein